MTPSQAAQMAAQIIGSQAAMARSLEVRTPTVSQWCSGVRPIPAARAIQIENLTSGKVSRKDLCPAFPWEGMAA
ncbi:Cro/CI family transcriptional regulator [Pantoea piersonii]|uniref:Cro/CI family transcriptional regulator n=1 Tax=Pantoea piersonii TaxID=2364647 RepID=UPI0028A75469|nr:Cro/CI family transcriptional regulator [Pantoea piersonii]